MKPEEYFAWWLSCHKMTVQVNVTHGVISRAAPIVKSFIGQPIGNLKRWMRRLGGYREELLGDE